VVPASHFRQFSGVDKRVFIGGQIKVADKREVEDMIFADEMPVNQIKRFPPGDCAKKT
jgi:hypothetical protein